jgi:hypothetical protein
MSGRYLHPHLHPVKGENVLGTVGWVERSDTHHLRGEQRSLRQVAGQSAYEAFFFAT